MWNKEVKKLDFYDSWSMVVHCCQEVWFVFVFAVFAVFVFVLLIERAQERGTIFM